MRAIFFEDFEYRNFYPLSLSRPVYMLHYGASALYEKWMGDLRIENFSFLCREYLKGVIGWETGRDVNVMPEGDLIFINGGIPPSDEVLIRIRGLQPGHALSSDGRLVACRHSGRISGALNELLLNLHDELSHGKLQGQFKAEEIKASGPRYLWEIVNGNGEMIARDFDPAYRTSDKNLRSKAKADLISSDAIFISDGVTISQRAVIDATHGPVIIGENVIIDPFSYIQGPSFIGPGCRIVGARIREGCSIGKVSRVGGEVEESIILGYCNKYHDGFLGHAYLGEWVNLGALTTNSDLKNNYSPVKVRLPVGVIDTGTIKVGCFIGDHTKTGIGTTLNTGISIGFSCNLYGSAMFDEKLIPSFSWGEKGSLVGYEVERAKKTAAVSMSRRGVEFTGAHSGLFESIAGLDLK